MNETEQQIPSEAVAALEQGNKIEAIKIVRKANGLELKESKDLVETYLQNNQDLFQRFSAIQSETNRSSLLKFLLLLVVAGIIAYLVSSRI